MDEPVAIPDGGVLGLIGDFAFPENLSKERLDVEVETAIHRMMSLLNQKQPERILVCPTPGVNINLLPFLFCSGHRVTLVLPNKEYINTLADIEQETLKKCMNLAEGVIIVNSSSKGELSDYLDDIVESSLHIMEMSDWVTFAHCDFYNPQTECLLKKIGDIEVPTVRLNLTKRLVDPFDLT